MTEYFKNKGNEDIKKRVVENGPFSRGENEQICQEWFSHVPLGIIRKWGLGNKSVLDVGCCYGHHLIHFVKGSMGLERQETMVEFARAIGLNVIQCNVDEKWDFNSSPFDAAWCFAILEHVVSPHKLLRECWLRLKDDGLLFVSVPGIPNFAVKGLFKVYKRRLPYLAVEHLYAYTQKTLRFLVERAGFKPVDTLVLLSPKLAFFNVLLKPLLHRYGGHTSLTLVCQKNPAFSHPQKRIKAFTPRFMEHLDLR